MVAVDALFIVYFILVNTLGSSNEVKTSDLFFDKQVSLQRLRRLLQLGYNLTDDS